ncbi:MAG: hypothetical protein V3V78_03970 [Candidatus Woesearchaeota archaeon]
MKKDFEPSEEELELERKLESLEQEFSQYQKKAETQGIAIDLPEAEPGVIEDGEIEAKEQEEKPRKRMFDPFNKNKEKKRIGELESGIATYQKVGVKLDDSLYNEDNEVNIFSEPKQDEEIRKVGEEFSRYYNEAIKWDVQIDLPAVELDESEKERGEHNIFEDHDKKRRIKEFKTWIDLYKKVGITLQDAEPVLQETEPVKPVEISKTRDDYLKELKTILDNFDPEEGIDSYEITSPIIESGSESLAVEALEMILGKSLETQRFSMYLDCEAEFKEEWPVYLELKKIITGVERDYCIEEGIKRIDEIDENNLSVSKEYPISPFVVSGSEHATKKALKKIATISLEKDKLGFYRNNREIAESKWPGISDDILTEEQKQSCIEEGFRRIEEVAESNVKIGVYNITDPFILGGSRTDAIKAYERMEELEFKGLYKFKETFEREWPGILDNN